MCDWVRRLDLTEVSMMTGAPKAPTKPLARRPGSGQFANRKESSDQLAELMAAFHFTLPPD
jgi:hypothetical protein